MKCIIEQSVKAIPDISQRYEVNICADKKVIKNVRAITKKIGNVDLLVLVGIGGSNLGAKAVQEALLSANVLYVDTVDSDDVARSKKVMQKYKKAKKKVVMLVISKSGTTTETITNFSVLERSASDIVIISTEGSELWERGKKKGYECVAHEEVGGRYSIFSSVGLLPLALMGVNIKKLLKGAQSMRTQCLKKTGPAAKSAAFLFSHKPIVHDTFFFSKDCESIGKWYRQLLAESIGKEHDKKGKVIHAGITPTVSIGSTDLHSLGQLYLGGPRDKVVTFVEVEGSKLPIPSGPYKGDMRTVMKAILTGTEKSFRKEKRPFMHLTLKKTEEDIGAFLQMKMMEVIYLAHFMKVNAFDQPAVEKYKKETRILLR